MKDRKAENSKNENPLFFKSVAHFLHQAGGNVDFYPPPIQVLNWKELCTTQGTSCQRWVKPCPLWWAYEKEQGAGSSCSVAWTTQFIWRRQQQSPQTSPASAVSQAWPRVGSSGFSHISLRGDRQKYPPGRLNSAAAVWALCYCLD